MIRAKEVAGFFASPRLALALFAFAAMGAWTLFVNAGNAFDVAARAGFLVGALSAAFALASNRALRALAKGNQGWVALCAPPLIVTAIYLAGLIVVLLISGARDIAMSIAAPGAFALIVTGVENGRAQRRS